MSPTRGTRGFVSSVMPFALFPSPPSVIAPEPSAGYRSSSVRLGPELVRLAVAAVNLAASSLSTLPGRTLR